MISVKRAAIYVNQLRDKTTLEPQIEQCRHYCNTRGYSVDDNQIYYEQSIDELDKPKLQMLLSAAKSGLMDVVVITGPGMLSSSPAEIVTILEQFNSVGVKIETTTPSFIDGLLNRPKLAELTTSKRYRQQKKRSRWTEYQVNGPAAIMRQNSHKQAAIYTRVQTHIEPLKTLCRRHGYKINDEHIYLETQQDEEYNRPVLQRLLNAATNSLIDVIVLNNVQDFSTRPSHLVTILQRLEQACIWVQTIE